DQLFLLRVHDEGHDAGENLLGLLGLLVEDGCDLLRRELQKGVQLLDLFLALGQKSGEIAGARLAKERMQEFGAPTWEVLSLQAIEGGQEQLRLPVVNFPHVAPGFGVAKVSEDLNSMVAVEDLVLAGLVRVRTD